MMARTPILHSTVLLIFFGQAEAQLIFQVLRPFSDLNATPRDAGADGQTVIGDSGAPFTEPHRVWRWRSSSGFEDLTSAFDGSPLENASTSATGDVIVGKRYVVVEGNVREVAARWTAVTGVGHLGWLPGATNSNARGVSGDGAAVVGSSGSRAFRWTAESGMTPLLPLPERGPTSLGNGISRDGRIIVGTSSGNNINQATRWLPDGTPQSLGTVPNAIENSAMATSADGSVVTGHVQVRVDSPLFSVPHAFRWTEQGGMVDLGLPSGGIWARPSTINGDGSAIGGLLNTSVVHHN